MVEVTFTVFDVASMPIQVPAKLIDGTNVMATVQATRVQLVPNDTEAHSTIALLLTGGDAAAAVDTFTPGAAIKATFVKE